MKKLKGKELELKFLPENYEGTFLKVGNKYRIINQYDNMLKINTPDGMIEIFKERFGL